MKTYTPTIGLEIHTELKTKTKMFCNSRNDPHTSEPNVHVCPVCMGHPGTLPVINKTAVMHVLTVGKALGATLATYTEFDRKNYFYPDIPKGYQISQYLFPLVVGGTLNGVTITRVHLEEDTARSLHDQGDGSIIDYNRAGVPLMELVTEPVIHDAQTASNFARELQILLKTLDVSDANMEKGEMRIEANISVSDTDTYGTKVEVKNLNSFKSVESAIRFEIERQIKALLIGEVIVQETRGWDEVKGRTFPQRIKESSNDYRYFPDPDLPKLKISDSKELLSRLNEKEVDLPEFKRTKYKNLGLTIEQSEIIISNPKVSSFYDSLIVLAKLDPKLSKILANYLISDLLPMISPSYDINTCNGPHFVLLMQMILDDKISSRVAKDALREAVIEGNDPEAFITTRGLLQSNTGDDMITLVREVILKNPSVVIEYKSGKESVLQFLVGQAMKISKGSANPQILRDLLKKTISEQ